MNPKDFIRQIKIKGTDYTVTDITMLEEKEIADIGRLPFSIRVLVENLLRKLDGRIVQWEDLENIAGWKQTYKDPVEIPYHPARVLMQDFTGVPAVVDLAAMRDAVKDLGGDPGAINPLVPVDLIIDHSVQIDYSGTTDSLSKNIEKEFLRNNERYSLLKWAQKSFDNFKVVPPGSGICHQVNLEYLGQVIITDKNGQKLLAYPDTLVGTDSHTTMINGLGVIGWGGNVFVPGLGSRVLLETVITDAVIDPDPMLKESPCDGCRICAKVCQAGFINVKEKDEVEIGDRTFTHNKKGSNIRCTLVCAGFSGQSHYDGWSTWSPGRVRLPDTDENIKEFFDKFVIDNMWRPNWHAHVLKNLALATEQGYMEEPKERLTATCGNCQLVCWGERKEREYNYRLLTDSGEVVEGKDFSFEVVRGV